jgi:hypothetical protein
MCSIYFVCHPGYGQRARYSPQFQGTVKYTSSLQPSKFYRLLCKKFIFSSLCNAEVLDISFRKVRLNCGRKFQ